MTGSLIFALALSAAMVAAAVFNLFFHDRKHVDLDRWIDYGFSRDTLRHVLLYYRFMGISMGVFYVLFVASCLFLQHDGSRLFAQHNGVVEAGVFGAASFALDLVLRGGFFDIMEHFQLSTTALDMNRENFWFVWYCFVFRIYYGLSLIRIALSFAWIWAKIYAARKKEFGHAAR